MNQQLQPPKWAKAFLHWFCSPDLIEDVSGDLDELYQNQAAKSNSRANRFYVQQVLFLFRPGIIRSLETQKLNTAMFNNYLKIALRNATRYKGHTALNVLGLLVGIASSLMILMWIYDEVTIDKFHSKGDQIHQLWRNMKQSNGMISTSSSQPKPLADLIREEYPEVESVTQVSWEFSMQFKKGDKSSSESGRFVTDNFFNTFSFVILAGDTETPLTDLGGVSISETMARKFYPENFQLALGESFRIDDEYDVIVTSIFSDPGNQSSLQFDWLINAESFFAYNDWVENWGNGSFGIYITIPDDNQVNAVADRVYNEINDHTRDNQMAGDETVVIQRFNESYLYSNFDNGVISGGRIDYVNILLIIAIFTLIIACINFMNLATARSGRRGKEIGIRKVMGAKRSGLRTQFYFESGLITVIAVGLSIGSVYLLLPWFNQLVNKELGYLFGKMELWMAIFSITLIVALLSGSYPALLLSKFEIVDAIKGSIKQSAFTSRLRKGLVVFQFAVSTLLIIGTVVIYQQISYALNKDLGLNKDNMVLVNLNGNLSQKFETYKTELLRIPEVSSVSGASGNPVYYGRSTSSASWDGKDPSTGYEINVILTDDKFFQTMQMEIISGRAFEDQSRDSTNFIINEVAASLIGYDNPIGKNLSFWGIDGKIVGVVKNFHMRNMYSPIAPLILTCIDYSMLNTALIRIDGDVSNALMGIEKVTKSLNSGAEYQYEFMEQTVAEAYENEVTVRTLASAFSGISILISCLGLFGLASYAAEQRSREIGVRKVHGATVFQILFLLSKDYSKLIAIAFLVAIPFAYFVALDWLANFEYRTDLKIWVFVMAGLTTFFIGVSTILLKSYQAASINPSKVLKEE